MAFLGRFARLTATGLQGSICSQPAAVRGFASHNDAPVYVLFGGTGGIGSSLAKMLAAHDGAQLVLVGRSKEKLDKLKSDTGAAAAHQVDVMKSQEVGEVLKEVADKHGYVSGVANLIGNMLIKPAHITSDADLQKALDTNVLSAFNVLKGSVNVMMKSKKGGSIVLASSSVAHKGVPNHEGIAAAKGAVAALTIGAASTYAPHGIRINAVAPGLIKTQMTESIWKSKNALQTSLNMHPLGRVGEPEDVARAVEFFLHPANSFVTGQVLGVDGGMCNTAPSRQGRDSA